MTGIFLGKQLALMSRLVRDDWDKVPKQDWSRLGSVIEEKQMYLSSIVDSIDSATFKDTKAKTLEDRETKIAKKIEEAKQGLRTKISSVTTLIAAALANISNCEKEVPIH